MPVGDGYFTPLVANEDGPVITRPGAISRAAEKLHGIQIGADFLQNAPGALLDISILDQDPDALHLGQLADDLAVDPGDGCEAARPIVTIVRPGDPGGFMRLPLS